MTTVPLKPFDQKKRIFALRASFLLLIPVILFTRPLYANVAAGELMEQAGIILVIACVLGRFWSILYIGGHKNHTVMDLGPYSMCRHPLYLSSTLGVIGFGLMLQSLVLTALIGGLTFIILNLTASREEAFLRSQFGPAYDAYAARTPRIIPSPFQFRSEDDVMFSVRHLRRNFFDALVFLSFIPMAEGVEWFRHVSGMTGIALP